MVSNFEFKIGPEQLETGGRGFPFGYCPTSSVDPEKGLYYQGQLVSELAHLEPEEVIFLLYIGHLGSKEEIKEFKDELAKRSTIRSEVRKAITALPRFTHPMNLLSAALLFMDTDKDPVEDALNLVARIPEVVALVINHHAGWGGTKPSNPSLGYMENFAQMLNVPNADLQQLNPVLKLFNILHYDHGGGNNSTFTAKSTASTGATLYQALSSAMNSLAGPKHGGANQDCLAFVKEVCEMLGSDATEKQVEELIRKRLENKELIYGFGHAVLRVTDPRATVLYDYADQHFPNNSLVRIARNLHKAGEKVLGENPKISDPHPNVDAISGTVLSAAGFDYPDYFTVLFGLSRCIGIARQIVYERVEARGGKGVPIYRTKYFAQKMVSSIFAKAGVL